MLYFNQILRRCFSQYIFVFTLYFNRLIFDDPAPLQFLRQHILLSRDLLLTPHILDLEDCGSITDDCDNSRRPATEGEDGSAEDMDDDDEVEDEDEDSVIEGTLAVVDQTHYEQDVAETFGTVSGFLHIPFFGHLVFKPQVQIFQIVENH